MGSSSQSPRRPLDEGTSDDERERLSSSELLRGRQQIEIDHAGEIYRLRLTKTGKLILTK